MSNNKQIEKPLELPHQETIVGINTIQTKPFDNQKEMSNNKQSSVDFLWNQLAEILKFTVDTETALKLLEAFEQAKEMHKEEIIDAYDYATMSRVYNDGEDYYNETFGGNNE